ncbi:putative sterigmatocystin 8-O-methyltransferase precursor [Nemania abortiva]|nr:putative sterigmatocystin 8-O-methyltransferase precursor [Nemania abortiva]
MPFSADEAVALAERIENVINLPDPIANVGDDNARRRLREAGRKLSLAMEEPGDTMHRINNTPLQLVLARTGVDARIFSILTSAQGSGLTNEELADKCDVDPFLMKRLLRYYQSHGMVTQLGNDKFGANNITKALGSKSGKSGIRYFFDTVTPAFMALPKFLRLDEFRNPTDRDDLPWHVAHDTKLSPFDWLPKNPNLEYFLPWMTAHREGLPIFLDVVDFQKEFAQGSTESTPLFVDVGGAGGHQCIALKQRLPTVPGRVILQDLPHVIDQVKAKLLLGLHGIEIEAYDFFQPQPVRGARTYYMRNILHDWPDEKCKEILENTKAGMTSDSVLLIDEMVLSERGAPWRATQLDMAMMACLGAEERSEAQWRGILESAGFYIKKIWKYTEECDDCILVAALK